MDEYVKLAINKYKHIPTSVIEGWVYELSVRILKVNKLISDKTILLAEMTKIGCDEIHIKRIKNEIYKNENKLGNASARKKNFEGLLAHRYSLI